MWLPVCECLRYSVFFLPHGCRAGCVKPTVARCIVAIVVAITHPLSQALDWPVAYSATPETPCCAPIFLALPAIHWPCGHGLLPCSCDPMPPRDHRPLRAALHAQKFLSPHLFPAAVSV